MLRRGQSANGFAAWPRRVHGGVLPRASEPAIAAAQPSIPVPTFAVPTAAASSYAPAMPMQTAASSNPFSSIFSSLKMMIPLTGDSNILPTIKKVYPTGEKPLVVLNFKCPTEVIGITPPPMKLLHEAVNLGFDGLNKTNLLSFNLQQVCS